VEKHARKPKSVKVPKWPVAVEAEWQAVNHQYNQGTMPCSHQKEPKSLIYSTIPEEQHIIIIPEFRNTIIPIALFSFES
jgi:hypothetical protein